MTSVPEPVLRWIFRRDRAAVTCEVGARPDGPFEVCTVPHWNVALAAIEPFHSAAAALRRHAEIAHRLRQQGWRVERVPIARPTAMRTVCAAPRAPRTASRAGRPSPNAA